jgi:hypothetical protein
MTRQLKVCDCAQKILTSNLSFLERGGRLYRPNIRDEPTAPHHIGKIDALLAKSSRALLARQMNEYNLVPLNDGSFACDVFWEQSSIANMSQSPEATDFEGTQVCLVSTLHLR